MQCGAPTLELVQEKKRIQLAHLRPSLRTHARTHTHTHTHERVRVVDRGRGEWNVLILTPGPLSAQMARSAVHLIWGVMAHWSIRTLVSLFNNVYTRDGSLGLLCSSDARRLLLCVRHRINRVHCQHCEQLTSTETCIRL